jgi:uroporphyrinogen-III synthase
MNQNPDLRPLVGRRILICRPEGQDRPLADHLRELGAETDSYAGIRITACKHSIDTQAYLKDLDQYQWAIFVSANAVEFGLLAALAFGPWPAHIRCAAIGKATALKLEQAGLGPVLRPLLSEDSEGLLNTDPLKSIQGQRILIFRGQGGRETLAEGLRARGGRVDYAEVYQRQAPTEDPGNLRVMMNKGQISAICVMSSESLHNVIEAFGQDCLASLCSIPWLVPHAKIAAVARQAGILNVIESYGSEPQALSSALIHFFRSYKS